MGNFAGDKTGDNENLKIVKVLCKNSLRNQVKMCNLVYNSMCNFLCNYAILKRLKVAHRKWDYNLIFPVKVPRRIIEYIYYIIYIHF